MAETDLSSDIEAISDVFAHTIELARSLTEEQGDLPTECPGWTVRDNLAHMVGLEDVLAGGPQPEVELPELDHVATDFDRFMEQQIHVRRGLSMSAIADEFVGLAPRRIAQLRDQASEGDPEVRGVFGPRPLSASLPIRVFDLWAHEQDIRRAVGIEPRMDCLAGRVAVERTIQAWSATLGDRVDGSGTVNIEVDGQAVASIPLRESGSLVTLAMSGATATRLGCGRGDVGEVLGDVAVQGDQDLLALVAPHLAFTP